MAVFKDIHDDELVAFYNQVEETIITLFGSYESAATYFDWRGSLDELWLYTKEHYLMGWHASRVARTWYGICVLGESATEEQKHGSLKRDYEWSKKAKQTDAKTSTPPKMVFDPGVKIISVKNNPTTEYTIHYNGYGNKVEIEKDVLAARAARAKRWRRSLVVA